MSGLNFTYKYAYESGLIANDNGRPNLSLATCNADATQPYFFNGKARAPHELGLMLHTLSDIVRTHYFKPMPANLDPVLTSHEEVLRLEGFSGCCGVYVRVDLPAESFKSDHQGRGTTNVDFNQPMRNALIRLREGDDMDFAVGRDQVLLSKGDENIIEKKVKLPARWIKSFSEVQSYQRRLKPVLEISGAEALRFSRSLPVSARPKAASYAVSTGRGLRLSHREQKGAVKFFGTHRVKAIEPILSLAKSLRVWSGEDEGTSAWEVKLPSGKFTMVISPEIFRGFSGEGQVLEELARAPEEAIIAQVRAQLTWGAHISASQVAAKANLPISTIEGAIAVLSTRGLAGYDASAEKYFYRELPFDLSAVEMMQPRLKNARKLVAAGDVNAKGDNAFAVKGTGTTHHVKLDDEGNELCTCPWFSKYQGQRGPCKHILAAQIFSGSDDI